MTPAVTACPGCGVTVPDDAAFCEACGATLAGQTQPAVADAGAAPAGIPAPGSETPFVLSGKTKVTDPSTPEAPPTCPECGGAYAADGYCTVCGSRRADPRDHFTEQPADWVVGVCDRGIRHAVNEDALALSADAGPGRRAVLVVCDGVSNTVDSEVASLAAARAARDLLTAFRGRGIGTPGSRDAAVGEALRQAAEAALVEVERRSPAGVPNPPSCTFTAAVVEDGRAWLGNIGDSRAYWLPDAGPGQALTVDDSVAAEQIAQGVPRAVAESGPNGHAITRWLGVDAPDGPPSLATTDLAEPGWLLLCSDGLWNYCSQATDLHALVRTTSDRVAGQPLALADALVGYANEQGGRDNISVALARIDPGPTS